MKIRQSYKKEELSKDELIEAYSILRVKYKLMGVDLPDMKVNMDPVEKKIHERYKELDEKPSSYFIGKSAPRIKTSEPMKTTGNKIEDLRTQLFDTIEKLKSGEIDIQQAKAISEISQVIINSAKVEIDFLKSVGRNTSGFFPAEDVKQLN